MSSNTSPKVNVPADLRKALAVSSKMQALWADLTPIARRDFVSWVLSAKQPETRKRRIAVTCSKLASGKRRPCCYAVVPMPLYKALGLMPRAKATWSDLTPDERRDIIDWVDAPEQKEERQRRIGAVCAKLAAGKRRP